MSLHQAIVQDLDAALLPLLGKVGSKAEALHALFQRAETLRFIEPPKKLKKRPRMAVRRKMAQCGLEREADELELLRKMCAELRISSDFSLLEDQATAIRIAEYLRNRGALGGWRTPYRTSYGRALVGRLASFGLIDRDDAARKPVTPRRKKAKRNASVNPADRIVALKKVATQLAQLAQAGDVEAESCLIQLSSEHVNSPIGAYIVDLVSATTSDLVCEHLAECMDGAISRYYASRVARVLARRFGEKGRRVLFKVVEAGSLVWNSRQTARVSESMTVLERSPLSPVERLRLNRNIETLVNATTLPRELRLAAIESTESIDALSVTGSLLRAAVDPCRRVRLSAAKALRKRGPCMAFPVLKYLAECKEKEVIRAGIQILVKIGKTSMRAVQPELFSGLPASQPMLQAVRSKHVCTLQQLKARVRSLLREFERDALPRVLSTNWLSLGSIELPDRYGELTYLAAALSMALALAA